MDKKHIYVNGRVEDVDAYKKSENFKSPPNYPQEFYSRLQPYEYGYLELEDCYIHFLIGNLPRKGCLYCGEPMELKKTEKKIEFGNSEFHFFMFCIHCTSRSQSLAIREQPKIQQEELEDIVQERLLQAQKYPRSWFNDFVNPWDKPKDEDD